MSRFDRTEKTINEFEGNNKTFTSWSTEVKCGENKIKQTNKETEHWRAVGSHQVA